ncbi:disks large-associated protein 5 [Rhinoraja longicauda]
MEAAGSRFAERYKTAGLNIEALRVKRARRHSVTQKENRQVAFRKSRRFEPLVPEETAEPCHAKETAAPSRLAMLQRYKEEKALRKMKEQRENPKRIFRVGVYKPDPIPFRDLKPLPPKCQLLKSKEKATLPSSEMRVTRSMAKNMIPTVMGPGLAAPKVGQVKSNMASNKGNCAVSVGARSQPQRAIQKTGTKVPAARKKEAVKPQPTQKKQGETVKNSNSKSIAEKLKPDPCEGPCMQTIPEHEVLLPESESLPTASGSVNQQLLGSPMDHEDMEKKVSFAPDNYVFAPMDGFDQIKFTAISPRSVSSFFATQTWSPVKPQLRNNADSPATVTRSQRDIFKPEVGSNLPKTQTEDPTSPAFEVPVKNTPPKPFGCSQPDGIGPVHDVAYFRGVVTLETEKLTLLCQQWDGWANADVVPDKVKELLRTSVGQARLLVAERFKQFRGLVDNCEFKTSEKEVSSADLEGFWDMVYFQVEDVIKKFERLKKIQANNWEETTLPQRVVKKKAARSKPEEVMKPSTAPKSRFAAVKAALKAKMKQETAGSSNEETQSNTIVFDAGFFRVESPAKNFNVTPKTCTPRQRSKGQRSLTRLRVRSATPASPVSHVTKSSSQQTRASFNSVTKTESHVITNVTMTGEGTAQQSTCSGKSTKQVDFEPYLQPRLSARGKPEAMRSSFHNDVKSSCSQESSAGDIELPEETQSSVQDVEMTSPMCEQPSTSAHTTSLGELPLTKHSGLLSPNSLPATLVQATPCSNSVGAVLTKATAVHKMQKDGNYMSPFGASGEDQLVHPFGAVLQDLISFSPSGIPQ